MWSVHSLLIITVGYGATAASGFVTGEATSTWITQRAEYNDQVICQVSTSTFSSTPADVSVSGDLFRRSTNHHLLNGGRSTWTPCFQV